VDKIPLRGIFCLLTTGGLISVIAAHREYPDDLTQWRNTLYELFSSVDLLEPFDRISIAIDRVHEYQQTQGS
jgi:hypothetical protein